MDMEGGRDGDGDGDRDKGRERERESSFHGRFCGLPKAVWLPTRSKSAPPQNIPISAGRASFSNRASQRASDHKRGEGTVD